MLSKPVDVKVLKFIAAQLGYLDQQAPIINMDDSEVDQLVQYIDKSFSR